MTARASSMASAGFTPRLAATSSSIRRASSRISSQASLEAMARRMVNHAGHGKPAHEGTLPPMTTTLCSLCSLCLATTMAVLALGCGTPEATDDLTVDPCSALAAECPYCVGAGPEEQCTYASSSQDDVQCTAVLGEVANACVIPEGGAADAGDEGEAAVPSLPSCEAEAGVDGACSCAGQCSVSCPGGGCQVVCLPGSTCSLACPGGGCHLACEGTASCTDLCDDGGCVVNCAAGSTCSTSCPGGACVVQCEENAVCVCDDGGC